MIIIGNLISLIAALFMMASCIVKERSRVFRLQFLQCLLLAVSSWFFSSYSGIAANIVSGLRNLVVASGKFTKRMVLVFLLLSVGMGVLFNNRGYIGLLPVIANIQFAVCSYWFTSLTGTRYSIWVNVLLWIIYSFAIMDISTAVSDSAVLILNTVSIVQLHKKRKAGYQTC